MPEVVCGMRNVREKRNAEQMLMSRAIYTVSKSHPRHEVKEAGPLHRKTKNMSYVHPTLYGTLGGAREGDLESEFQAIGENMSLLSVRNS